MSNAHDEHSVNKNHYYILSQTLLVTYLTTILVHFFFLTKGQFTFLQVHMGGGTTSSPKDWVMIGLRLSQMWFSRSLCQWLVELWAPNIVLANEKKSASRLLGKVYLTNKKEHTRRNSSSSSPQDRVGPILDGWNHCSHLADMRVTRKTGWGWQRRKINETWDLDEGLGYWINQPWYSPSSRFLTWDNTFSTLFQPSWGRVSCYLSWTVST